MLNNFNESIDYDLDPTHDLINPPSSSMSHLDNALVDLSLQGHQDEDCIIKPSSSSHLLSSLPSLSVSSNLLFPIPSSSTTSTTTSPLFPILSKLIKQNGTINIS